MRSIQFLEQDGEGKGENASEKEKEVVELDEQGGEKGLGRGEEWETMIKIYCVKKNLFSV